MFKLTQTYIVGLITASFLVGCGGGGGDTSNTNDTSGTTSGSTPTSSTTAGTTVQCKQIAPVLNKLDRKYATSKDDYEVTKTAYRGSKGSGDSGGKGSSGSGGSHNEGRNCLSCHSFASAGTVFTSLHAANNTPGAAGYRIKLSTGVVYGSARGTGNSRSSSFPSGKFTAQVIDPNGNVVNSSADMSHDASRRACNSCHSASGNSGAPGRITSKRLSSTTPTSTVPATTVPTTSNCTNADGSSGSVAVSFNSNVLPILSAKCKTCHGSNGRFTVTSANATYANISALKGSTTAGGNYLLQKGSNSVGHGGGKVIATSSGEYTTIKAWVNAGAPNN